MAAYAVLSLVALATVLVTMMSFTRVSAFDEATHADYAWRVSQGELPKAGDPLAEPILREWSCRGPYDGSGGLPSCDSPSFDYSDYPAGGLQYNYGHPPLYYAITGVLARGLSAVSGQEFMTMARLVGAGWLALGLAALFHLMRTLGIPVQVALPVAISFAFIPAVAEFASIVSNDAASFVAGGAAILVGIGVVQGRMGWGSVVLLGALVTMTKVIFVVALGAVCCFWLIVALQRSGRERSRLFGMIVLLAGVSASLYVMWSTLQGQRVPAGYTNPVAGINTRSTESFPFGPIVRNLFEAWPPTASRLPGDLGTPQIVMWAELTTLLLGAGVLAVMVASRDNLRVALSLGVAAGIVAVPIIVETFAYRDGGQYFPVVSARYGIVLLPAIAALLAVSLQRSDAIRRTAGWSVAILGGVCLFTSMVAFV